MKLWLIEQDQVSGYDTYDSAVVAAETEIEARYIHPCGGNGWSKPYPEWAKSPDAVRAKIIGDAAPGVERGVILASFNAG